MKTTVYLIAFLLICCSVKATATAQRFIVAYVTSWSDIIPDPACLTHINYAFGHVNHTFDGIRIDREDRLRTIVALKDTHPHLRVLLSIGGWGSGRFSEMAADDSLRSAFAEDCRRVVRHYRLDGIDLDWEFPGSDMAGISASPDDTRNFTRLVRDIRRQIGDSLLLTLASSCSARYVNFREIHSDINFVNIMTYDMASPPHHHAALHRSPLVGYMSVDESVDAHISAGIPPEKLTLGVPFYGHGRRGLPRFIAYKEIIRLEGYAEQWDDAAQAPYLTGDSLAFVCTYDNPRSIAAKCRYLLRKGLLGAMYWDYDSDDAEGTLRKAVRQSLMLRQDTCVHSQVLPVHPQVLPVCSLTFQSINQHFYGNIIDRHPSQSHSAASALKTSKTSKFQRPKDLPLIASSPRSRDSHRTQ